MAGQVNGYSKNALVAEASTERHHHHSFALPCLKKRTLRSARPISSGTFFSLRTVASDEPQVTQLDNVLRRKTRNQGLVVHGPFRPIAASGGNGHEWP